MNIEQQVDPILGIQGKPHLVAKPAKDRVELNWGWLTWGSGYRVDQEWQEPAGFVLLHSSTGLDDLAEIAYLAGEATSYLLTDLEEQTLHYFALQAYWQTGDTFTSNRVAVMPGAQHSPQALFPGTNQSRYWGSWSPAGKHVAYVSKQPLASEGGGVYVYSLDQRTEAFWRGGLQPEWSPEGEQLVAITDLAFNRNHPDSTSFLTLLTPNSTTLIYGGDAHLMQPTWSPNGRRWMYLGRAMGEDSYTLYHMSAGSDFEPSPLMEGFSELAALPTPAERSPGHPRWHPSGRMVVYHRFAAKSYLDQEVFAQDIFLFSLSSRTSTPLIESPWNDSRPAYAPDGQHLAFVSDRAGQPGLWIYSAESRRLKQIYGGSEPRVDDRLGRLAWSPDGRQLLFNAWVNDTLTSLYTIEVTP